MKKQRKVTIPLQTHIAETCHLTTLEYGIYCRLLFASLNAGRPLLDDDVFLAKRAHVTLEQWGHAAPSVRPFFVEIVDDGGDPALDHDGWS